MKTRYIEVERIPRKRRYKRCGCRRNRSPIVDTFHAPLLRWGLTILALLAVAAHMTWPVIALTAAAAAAWKHH